MITREVSHELNKKADYPIGRKAKFSLVELYKLYWMERGESVIWSWDSALFQDEHGAYDSALSQYQLALEALLPILSGKTWKLIQKLSNYSIYFMKEFIWTTFQVFHTSSSNQVIFPSVKSRVCMTSSHHRHVIRRCVQRKTSSSSIPSLLVDNVPIYPSPPPRRLSLRNLCLPPCLKSKMSPFLIYGSSPPLSQPSCFAFAFGCPCLEMQDPLNFSVDFFI